MCACQDRQLTIIATPIALDTGGFELLAVHFYDTLIWTFSSATNPCDRILRCTFKFQHNGHYSTKLYIIDHLDMSAYTSLQVS